MKSCEIPYIEITEVRFWERGEESIKLKVLAKNMLNIKES